MSAKYKSPSFLLPNELNTSANPANDTGINSLYSMDFDSTTKIPNITGLGLGTSVDTFSISLWFNKSNMNYGIVFSSYSGSGTYPSSGVAIDLNTNGTIAFYNGANRTTTSAQYSINTWYNLVVTSDGTTVKMYVNGSQVTLDSTTVVARDFTNVWINSAKYSSNNFGITGKIDGVSIFNYALTDGTGGTVNQIAALHGSSSTGIGNPMAISGGGKPVAFYQLGDKSAFNNSNYLIPNSSLKDFVFNFDAANNDKIDCGSISQTNEGDISFSVWCNLTTTGGYFSVLSSTDSQSRAGILIIIANNGKIKFERNQNISGTRNNSGYNVDFSFGSWNHLCGTFDSASGVLKAYVNGVLQNTSNNTTNSAGVSGNLTIGALVNNTGYSANGSISNVQIFNTALSATGSNSVETLYNNGSPLTSMTGFTSLVSWWKLDASDTYDSSTTTWTIEDHAGSNDGTSLGMTQANLVQSDLSFTSGYSPYALDFDSASGNYIDCGQNTNLDTGDLSASIWVNKDSTGSGTQYFFNNNNGSSIAGFCFLINNTNQIFINRRTRTKKADSGYLNIGFTEDAWHHLCFTYNDTSGAYEVYFNGNSVFTITASAKTCGISQNITIGENSGLSGLNFEGKLSNASIWNTALTSSQVSEIYSEGIPQNLLNHSAVSSLVSWWQLGSNSSFNTNWTVLDEKGSNNGTSTNMGEDAIVDGVGSYANGVSSGMSDNIVGSAPFSDANSLSYNMDVLDRVEDTPN